MRRASGIVLLVLGIVVLVAIATAREHAAKGVPPSTYSTYDTGPNGYRALYDGLASEGVEVRRNERDLGLLDPSVKTLVESSVAPELAGRMAANPLGDRDVTLLRRFLRGGGRLIVLDGDFGGEADARLGLPGSRTVKKVVGADAIARTAATAGVTRLDGPVAGLFPLTLPKATPLLGADGGLVAIAYPFLGGEVVAVTAPAFFGNAQIAKADNARFAYDLLAGRGAVVFDERPHGYAVDKSFWEALPPATRWAFWIVCAIVALALIGASVRFAPPIPLDPPDERDSSAYVRAMADLLRRARSARVAIAAFADDAARRARGRSDLLPESAAMVAELERLRSETRPGDAALVRAAVLDARLRKELS